jgi:Bacteriophage HK97-gp10, putative tail-component
MSFIEFVAQIEGETVIRAALMDFADKYDGKIDGALVATAVRAVNEIQAIARVDSGNFQSNIAKSEVMGTKGNRYIRVFSPDPYARRLEFDYHGPDSRGRTFDHTSLPAPSFGVVAPRLPGYLVGELRG